MVKISKRMKEAAKVTDKLKRYTVDEALDCITGFPKVKFDETVELHLSLNISSKSSDQSIRLPCHMG